MAVPRNRLSNRRKKMRRAHHAKKPANIVACANCGVSKRHHTLCDSCGHYAGRAMVEVAAAEQQ